CPWPRPGRRATGDSPRASRRRSCSPCPSTPAAIAPPGPSRSASWSNPPRRNELAPRAPAPSRVARHVARARELRYTSSMALVFEQLFDPESSTYTYLVGCSTTKVVALIDPVV